MAQGFLWSFSVGSIELNFKSVTVDERATQINDASRFLSDGVTINSGYNSNQGDLGMVTFTCEELMDGDDSSAGNLSTMLDYYAGGGGGGFYGDVDWELSYDDVTLYSGTGLNVPEITSRGSIPGEAAFRITFESHGPYDKG